MKEKLFTGVCTAMVTPFLGSQINYPLAELLLKRQLDAGVNNIVIAGTTGESATLSDDEKAELFSRCKRYIGRNGLIIAGTGSNSTAHAIRLSIEAEKAGADALLVVTPYYNKATPDGLIAHYLAIAEAVGIPIIVYNVPSRTGVDIPVSVYRQLNKVPNIVGIKEAGTDLTKITKIRNVCPDIAIYSGNDDLTVPVISLGGDGVISVVSNVLPAETALMTVSALAGDMSTASAMQRKLQPLIEMLFCEVNPIPVKAAMKCIGYDCGNCRMPLTPMGKEHYKQLRKILCS